MEALAVYTWMAYPSLRSGLRGKCGLASWVQQLRSSAKTVWLRSPPLQHGVHAAGSSLPFQLKKDKVYRQRDALEHPILNNWDATSPQW